ncbi:HAMP domain-containing sensor histidine kinase [Variovorax sp. GB1R11]|uniref:HAMP domain-containing sensor histidine kinase n=1 Tax=Variovorax sp. GB1R11 TaxID=3443741 RepID=UPI003F49A6FD
MVRPTRLFRKLLLVLSSCMISSIGFTALYLWLIGVTPPPGDPVPKVSGLPVVPVMIAVVASLVFGGFLAWYLSRPLQHLRWGLQRMAEGHLDTRVEPLMKGRRDEITDLAHDIDGMAGQLQTLIAARDRLLHDISHELRSPLSRIQAAIGLLEQDSSQVGAMVERVERETRRLDALIDEMLTLHRLTASAPVSRSAVDVIELLHDIVADADFEGRAMNRSVSIETPERFVAQVDGELIYRAFENVIRNAVKHTSQGSTVEVRARLREEDRRLEVVISDHGPGVPPHMLEAIFVPFVRIDRREVDRGVGLGLAIARSAVLAHDGTIGASLADNGGLQIRIELPR